jgi:hypothetical protein
MDLGRTVMILLGLHMTVLSQNLAEKKNKWPQPDEDNRLVRGCALTLSARLRD